MPRIIKFYSASEKYGEFSNLFPRRVEFNGRDWESTEAAYQFAKFKAEYRDVAEWLVKAPRQSAMAICGHGFNKYKKYIRDDWGECKLPIMKELIFHKFNQHADIRELLLSTGDAVLVEDSPHDSFWGCGPDGKGRNQLGVFLMEIRELFKK